MKHRHILAFILIYLHAMILAGNAQTGQEHFQLITEQQGLTIHNINTMLQDSKGYLWFGGFGGLNRYDGYAFETFRKQVNNPGSLSGHVAVTMAEDHNGMIWVGFDNGSVSCLNPLTRQVTRYKPDSKTKGGLPDKKITRIFIDRSNQVWLAAVGHGLMRFNRSTGSFIRYPALPGIGKEYSNDARHLYNTIYDMYEDADSVLWLASHNGLYSFNHHNKIFKEHRLPGNAANKIRSDLFLKIIAGKDHDLWLGSWAGGLAHYHITSGSWQNFKPAAGNTSSGTLNIISDLTFRNDSELWVTSLDAGFGTFSLRNKTFRFFRDTDPEQGKKTPLSLCRAVLTDRDGSVWVAHAKGLSRIRQGLHNFRFHPLPVKHSDNGDYYFLSDMIDDTINQCLFIATSFAQGLYVVDKLTGKTMNYNIPLNPGNIEKHQRIVDGLDAGENFLWLATTDQLLLFNKRLKQFVPVPQPPFEADFKGPPGFTKIVRDSKNNLWISSERQGVYCYNPIAKTYRHYLRKSRFASGSLCSNQVIAIGIDRKGLIWMGSKSKGISIYNPRNNTMINYRHTDEDAASISSDKILCIDNDATGNTWLGTAEGGLVKATVNNNGQANFTTYSTNTGLPSDNVYAVACDLKGATWCVTDGGITRVEPLSGRVVSFAEENDLKPDYIYYLLSTGSDGTMYAGAPGGYYEFNQSVMGDTAAARIEIKSIKAFDKEIIPQQLNDHAYSIDLLYSQNFFTCEFTVINFINPAKNQYAYQLTGFDKEPVYLGARRFLSFTNIPPGQYVLHLMASSSDGSWNRAGTTVHIRIIPPFWKEVWFRLLVILLVVLIAGLLYYMHINNIKRQAHEKSEADHLIAEARLSALRAQMNPHFIFNSLNSIQQFIASSDKDNALKYLSKFSRLIRLVLQNSQSSTNTIEDELNMLQFYLELEALRFSNKFSYHFEIDRNISRSHTQIPAMLLQPFVENALIHGLLNKDSGGKLLISIQKVPGKLVCMIEDNGIGRKAAAVIKQQKSKHHESLGIKVTEERIGMLEQLTRKKASVLVTDLADGQGNSTGTRVRIEIAHEE